MSLSRSVRIALVVGVFCLGTFSSVVLPEEAPPVHVGAGSVEEVRLITIDALVLDKHDRTVAGLGPEDFTLTVDGNESPIETFDAECIGGALDEPVARKRLGDPLPASEPGQAPRRIVLALDYHHLSPPPVPGPRPMDPGAKVLNSQAGQDARDPRPAIFDNLRDAITSGFAPSDEFMLAAFANGLRVEQPFTADRAQLLESLQRMQYDVSLWNGNFSHSTEAPTLLALEVLMEVLGELPGPKAVVLFSQGVWPNRQRDYDPEFVRVSAKAGNARVTIYPVMARGLVVGGVEACPDSCKECEPNGAPGLDRLAGVSGGRVTRNTNDLALGATRASRDLGCRYTLGFYDREPGEYRVREVSVSARRPELRVLHATQYSFRAPEEKRAARLGAAWMVPTMFPGGVVRAHLFPLRPQDAKRWQARLAVEFPVALLGGRAASEPFTFGATVMADHRVVHQFSRKVHLKSKGAVAPDRLLKFFQDVTLRPGQYQVTAVAEGAGGEKIFTASARVQLPTIPLDEPFIVGPTLGRAAANDLSVRGGTRLDGKKLADDPTLDSFGTAERFAPILVTEIEKRDRIAASSLVCLLSNLAKPKPVWFERSLFLRDGAPAGTLEPIEVLWTSEEKVRCEQTLDVVPVGGLRVGDYRFDARLRTADQRPLAASSVPFSVIPLRPVVPNPEPVDDQP